jgi:hypothetical protein
MMIIRDRSGLNIVEEMEVGNVCQQQKNRMLMHSLNTTVWVINEQRNQ